ncbi:HET-domain-containing protein [Microthyrium microscopicum]|uniref:HET-domain-containing protein n=1 Tax=Microthyrium microscopicum TaxID=703497 RepID=A0A6A6UQL3_9PEZI|nr:HET-domain-containing protein [Microthyrium microscopicum]
MWLINVHTMKLESFQGADVPKYAILSHTWSDHELDFQDMAVGWNLVKIKPGAKKIEYTCDQAKVDKLQYAWVDTCCINKSSSAELSEAINSMFRWYKDATKCYAFLVDVIKENFDEQFPLSRWFTRGWTLQELIAPAGVIFHDVNWTVLGSKQELLKQISEITGIDEDCLEGAELEEISIAKKMSWAAGRTTTRTEDVAYCLLGLFGVNMPLLYGEDTKAFARLQEEIMKVSNDQSLFAWKMADTSASPDTALSGLLANSPADFINCRNRDSSTFTTPRHHAIS